jgi:hypothetical protein
MLEVLEVVLPVLAVFTLVVGGWAIARHFERQRSEALNSLAARRGWHFEPEAPELLHRMERFDLLAIGDSRTATNALSGEADEGQFTLFDYTYVTGSGKSRRTWRQSVCLLESPTLDLPSFRLEPEGVLQKLGALFGVQDIDLPGHPEFSTRYTLRGRDEQAVRELFGPEVVRFFERRRGWSCAGQGQELFLWRKGERAKPEGAEALRGDGLELAALFAEQAQPPHALPRSFRGG